MHLKRLLRILAILLLLGVGGHMLEFYSLDTLFSGGSEGEKQDSMVMEKKETQQQNKKEEQDKIPEVCFDNNCFEIEIADKFSERQQGLMGRKTLDKDAGMLFIFPDEATKRTFWMKNTLISLDMIRLDETKTIVHIEENVPPCEADPCPHYGPNLAASRYVVELNAGTIQAIGSAIGDKVSIYKVDPSLAR